LQLGLGIQKTNIERVSPQMREAGLQRTHCATCGGHLCYLRWTVIF